MANILNNRVSATLEYVEILRYNIKKGNQSVPFECLNLSIWSLNLMSLLIPSGKL